MPDKPVILVIADPNPDLTRTLSQACSMAQDIGARLWIAGFTSKESPDPAFEPRLKATIKRALDGFEDCTLSIESDDDIAGWVTDQCKIKKVDLIIKTGHRSETIFYSPIDWHLIRETKVPVLLLTDSRFHKNLQTILATVDVENDHQEQEALDKKVLEYGALLAQQEHAVLHAAVCVATSQILSDLDVVNIHKREQAHAPHVREAIAAKYQSVGIEPENWHIHAGVPEKVLSGIADGINADLIIVGSVGRKRLQGLLVGNTAERILKNVRTNVLVVKPD